MNWSWLTSTKREIWDSKAKTALTQLKSAMLFFYLSDDYDILFSDGDLHLPSLNYLKVRPVLLDLQSVTAGKLQGKFIESALESVVQNLSSEIQFLSGNFSIHLESFTTSIF